MKKLPLIALGLLIAVQFAVPFKMIQGKENILRNGTEFKFKTRPIDPADPFQGRYVRLAYEDDYIPGNKKQDPDLAYKQPIYALLQTGEDGFAVFTGWSIEKPIGGHYLKTRSLGRKDTWNRETKKRTDKGLRIDLPFDRFYMDEAKAPRAEVLAREATRNTNCWASVRILAGKAVIEDVFAKGQSLRDLASKKE
ncbi:GDYXXLXY domain-containing protein [Pontiella sulfatireligans]|uniref:GDYXXLXY domain-containing protein n=1 Tax=Pontiella sulfatireligans TaxID=2750658 RepID=A0A6C2UDW5_9BACT|nr:GDYXXLXY domain-containing protein [Pontiella sulfatireligans]VGO18402.1 hypothetical protein SCARR_00455 [Pontiella sulfatireligans]